MKTQTITLHLPETTCALLAALDPAAGVAPIIERLCDHAQQGVYRPGAWERNWLTQVFPLTQWEANLEPGCPYGRPDCEHLFVRPKTSRPAPTP